MRALTLTAAGAVVAATAVLAVSQLWDASGDARTDDGATVAPTEAEGPDGTAAAGPTPSPSPSPTEPVRVEVPDLPTPPFEGPVLGAHVHALWDHYDEDTRAAVFDELVTAGVRTIRVDVGWASLEEQCRACVSQWYLDRLDRMIEQARERGLEVLGVLWRTPSWAGDGDPEAPPHDVAEYGRVAGWLAERYEGHVAAWELWNEPNLDDYFHGDVEDYLQLVAAASPEIRAADPAATIVLAGPAHNDSVWLRDVLERDVGSLVDVVAMHSYPTPSDDPPTLEDPDGDIGRIAHLTTVLDLVDELAPGTPLWLTEFGWSSHETEEGAAAWERGVTPDEQARFATEMLVLLRDRWPAVERAYWYRALDRTTGRAHSDGFGLFDAEGEPKPVLRELRRLLWEPEGAGPSPEPD